MINKKDIQQIYFRLSSEGRPYFSLMLSSTGSINRMGNGNSEEAFPQMAMGNIGPELFQELIDQIPEDWFSWAGRYTMPEQKGSREQLHIAFSSQQAETGFEFDYGSDSEGPPDELVSLTEYAISLTEEWYDEQLSRKNKKRKA